jgi:hypothetical protein
VRQLEVCKCNECGQPLPENFQPPADEPWTTGIFGCAEDTESCEFICNLALYSFKSMFCDVGISYLDMTCSQLFRDELLLLL